MLSIFGLVSQRVSLARLMWAKSLRPVLEIQQFRGKVGSDGFEKALIGTRGARETFLRGRKGRAAKNSVLTSGEKQLKC